MNKLLTTIFILIGLVSFSQTNLDSLIMYEVNDYRYSLGVDSIRLDSSSFLASQNQSLYLQDNDIVGHSQIGELETTKDRYVYFGGTSFSIAEVCNSINININADNSYYLDDISLLIVDSWKKSKSHDSILKDPKYKFAGISSQVKTSSVGIKGWVHYDIVSVMVFTID